MEHGGEAARPTTLGSAELGMAGAVRGSQAANIGSGAFDDAPLAAAAARRFGFDASEPGAAAAAYHNNSADELARHVRAAAARGELPPVAAGFHFHRQPGPGVAYANIVEFGRQPGPVRVVIVCPRLPDGVLPVYDSYGYAALPPPPGAGRGVVLADLLTGGGGGEVYDGDYALQPRRGAGHGEVLLAGSDDAVYHSSAEFARHVRTDDGRGEVPVAVFHREPGPGVAYPNIFDGEFWLQPGPVRVVLAGPHLPDALVPVHDNDYGGYSALQPRPGAGRGVVLADKLTGGGGAVYNGDYAWQPRPGAGRGEVFLGPLPGGVGAVFDNLGNFGQPTLPGTGRADGIAGALRDPNLGAGYDGSGPLADDLGAVYDNPGMAAQHLRRLLPFAGIGASSVAVNGLAAGMGSPAVAFHLFVLLLGGLFLIMMHVLRV